jgi:hypothetical protein
MQIVIQVICSSNASLREAIIKDKQLADYRLQVSKQKSVGRNPGWAKIHSTERFHGAVNVAWDAASKILLCRVVSKEANTPGDLIGDFIAYLLARHKRRIKVINILPI